MPTCIKISSAQDLYGFCLEGLQSSRRGVNVVGVVVQAADSLKYGYKRQAWLM
jgi:hypothetical protein